MIVLYVTNKDITDWDLIPGIIQQTGDSVITHTGRVDVSLVKDKKIDFIVCDRARNLVPKDVIDLFPNKVINFHPSFLPWNRGYHPNFWSIYEGTPFGVTLHHIDEGIDSGNIIGQTRACFHKEETLRETYDRLRTLMVDLFKSLWPDVRTGKLDGIQQDLTQGNIHYRQDFDGILEQLPKGWDTRICDIPQSLK